MIRLPKKRQVPWLALLVGAIAGLVYAPILYRMASGAYDYKVHLDLAAKIASEQTVVTPHFLFQLLTAIINVCLKVDIATAGVMVLTGAIMATTALVFIILNRSSASTAASGLLALSLTVASPVTVLFLLDHKLYFGYIGLNVYHNPTIILLKPFALAAFLLSVRCLMQQERTFPAVLLAALVSILGALAKPSFTICLLPALMLLALVRLARKAPVNWPLLISGFLAPSLLVLAIQYNFSYSVNQVSGVYAGESHIIFAPLVFMREYSSWLTAKFFLSILFPLAVTISYREDALRNPQMLIAWTAFMFGALYTYLLGESGPRLMQGNFLWSGQITLFMLFVASAGQLCRQLAASGRSWLTERRVLACLAVLCLHLISGLIFYGAEFYDTEAFW